MAAGVGGGRGKGGGMRGFSSDVLARIEKQVINFLSDLRWTMAPALGVGWEAGAG